MSDSLKKFRTTSSSSFPFLWGAATSAHQVEGSNHHSDWWAWEEKGNIEGGVRSGLAADHWSRMKEDLDLAAKMGLNSYRFSIEWAKVEPRPGEWDSTALEWYRSLIQECEVRGLVPMLTLHHFTSPQWFMERGGFADDASPALFMRFVKKVVEDLGASVPLWCTFNEPMVMTAGGYLARFMPPAEFAPQKLGVVSANLLRCHVQAYDWIHQNVLDRTGPWKHYPIQVGIAQNMLDFMPDRAWHPIEQILSRVFWSFYNDSWMRAVTGKKPGWSVPFVVPKGPSVPEALGRRTIDYVGINYYTKAYVKFRPRDQEMGTSHDLPVGIAFARRKEAASDVGWAFHPQGMRKLMRKYGRLGMPVYITENGLADHQDSHRADYLETHLSEISHAIAEGIDVRGYYHWSLMDNFEWIKGFGPRFGLIEIDYANFKRNLRPSGEHLREMINEHREGEHLHPPSAEKIEKIRSRRLRT